MENLSFDPWPAALGVYLDYNATTPVAQNVRKAMEPYLSFYFANAASPHLWGKFSRDAVETARAQIAQALEVSTQEIYFTSGATEGLNLAIRGLWEAYPHKNHLITAPTEHNAVLETCQALVQKGLQLTFLPVDANGNVNPDDLRKSLRPNTLAVVLMAANNEIGTLHPIETLTALTRQANVPFICDATQAVGKILFPLGQLGVDIAVFSAHKFYGPKGIGGLYVRRRRALKLMPLLYGGGHEGGLRSGTLNVPGIVGMATALTLGMQDLEKEAHRQSLLRDELQTALMSCEGAFVVAAQAHRLPNTLSIGFLSKTAEKLLASVPQLAVSTGAACTSAKKEPSHVLRALGLSPQQAEHVIRISLGRPTQEKDIQLAQKFIAQALMHPNG
ncbi:MAG: cysteine desulfurase family protein [Bacteroidia bacterium]